MSETAESPEDAVLRAIRRIVRRVADHSRALARDYGLTVPQLLVLRTIGEYEEKEPTLAAVSQAVHLAPATVSRIIDRLERAGLVERKRRGDDRRRVALTLTAAGLDRFSTLPTPLQEAFVGRLRALPPKKRRALLESLDTVARMMDAADLDAAPVLAPDLDPEADASGA